MTSWDENGLVKQLFGIQWGIILACL